MTTTPPPRDRRQLLLQPGAAFNGIDYVEVAPDQTHLLVHFLNAVPVAHTLIGHTPVTVTGGEVVPTVALAAVDEARDWTTDSQDRPVLALTAAAPGDFSSYRLTVRSSALDPFFDQAPFSFKANCPTTLDCLPPVSSCPPAPGELPPIDYLAKDFGSFRQALSQFSALRYPAWVERSEADVGVVLMEAIATVADELSYYQDRVSAESTLQTATQQLSVLRHARLVDYEPAPATVATTLLQLEVRPPAAGVSGWTIDTPLLVQTTGADGAVIDFEVEDPAAGLAGPVSFAVDTRWNRAGLPPYYWDDSRRCLPIGATDFYVQGQGLGLLTGQQLLLDSPAPDSADPAVRELVTVSDFREVSDPLLNAQLTRVFLQAPTRADHDLSTMTVAGNIVPAVQGRRHSETFLIPDPTQPSSGPVIVRGGAGTTAQDAVPQYRYCLSVSPLAWIATPGQDQDTALAAQPEITLAATAPTGATSGWTFTRWLLQASPTDTPFTITPEQYSPVLSADGMTWYDYDGDQGTCLRFGDGTFGAVPVPGTSVSVVYRVGAGAAGNVPADTIVDIPPNQTHASLVAACINPFPAGGGTDAETLTQVRTRAPHAFSAHPLRVVRAADYVAAAQSLPWVQQAGTTPRWTGSWLSVFTSADPVGAESPTIEQLTQLTELLDRRRLAGYDSYVLPPRYVSIDVQITVCGRATAFASDVATAIVTRLLPGALPDGGVGFFDHSRWGFGQPLESSALLAAIQSCPGVEGVSQVLYRQRGLQTTWNPLPETLTVASDQILRLDNDPSRPEAGSLQVTVEGSK